MSRRGQCRCGLVLTFQRTEQGYKMRCPSCGAVVRLRGRHRHRESTGAKAELMAAAPSLAPPGPDEFDVEPVPLSDGPTRPGRKNRIIAFVAVVAGGLLLFAAAGLALWLLG